MKKKIVGGIMAIAVVMSFNVSFGTQNSNLSAVSLANLEALAQNEGGGYSCSVTRDCGGGATVSCSGTKLCEHISGPLGSINGRGVKCDGNVTKCP